MLKVDGQTYTPILSRNKGKNQQKFWVYLSSQVIRMRNQATDPTNGEKKQHHSINFPKTTPSRPDLVSQQLQKMSTKISQFYFE